MEANIAKNLITPLSVDCPSFMMIMPTHANEWENNKNNVWCDGNGENQTDEDLKIDGPAAFGQWFELYSFLTQQGLVTLMPSPAQMDGLADHVYAANSGIMIGDTYIVANFTSEPRRPETPVIETFMKTMGCKVVVCPYLWEGEAETKFIGKNTKGQDVFIGGYGIRSTIEAYEWMEKEFNVEIIKVKMTDDKLYHLDCSIFPLVCSNNLEEKKAEIMCCEEIFSNSDLEKIKKYCKCVNVPLNLAYYGITNCVRCGSYILCGSDFFDIDPDIDGEEVYCTERDKNQFLEDLCAEYGFEVKFFNLSEFAKAGACLSCNVCHINRYSYSIDTI